jgi:hypothetical protein
LVGTLSSSSSNIFRFNFHCRFSGNQQQRLRPASDKTIIFQSGISERVLLVEERRSNGCSQAGQDMARLADGGYRSARFVERVAIPGAGFYEAGMGFSGTGHLLSVRANVSPDGTAFFLSLWPRRFSNVQHRRSSCELGRVESNGSDACPAAILG